MDTELIKEILEQYNKSKELRDMIETLKTISTNSKTNIEAIEEMLKFKKAMNGLENKLNIHH